MEEHGTVKGRRRHIFVWKALRPLARLICWIKFGFTSEVSRVRGPFLLVSNHVTNWDPILVACSFPEQAYFVTSEHLLRAGLGGKLVGWLQSPIPRQKSGSAATTVLTMMRYLRRGLNVCVFPEGNRTWDGVTAEFLPSIAKLARTSGASLVTYKLTGGYFASPRWAGNSIRRGKMHGRAVRVYSPEELRGMRPAAINELVAADLYCDNYAIQREKQIPFRTRHGAEHMETLFFLCPRCGGVSTLHSHGDTVQCSDCSLTVRYLPTGFLAGDIPFDNIRDWNLWQREQIRSLCESAGEAPIFTDEAMELYAVETARGRTLLHRGGLALYRDRLEMPGVTLTLDEIVGISLRSDQDLYVGAARDFYLLHSDRVCCTSRYLTAIAILTGREFGV